MTLDRRAFLATASISLVPAMGGNAAEPEKKEEKPQSLFLQGNYAPIRKETTADDLKIIGKLPAELEGMFVRNGPDPRFDPKGAYHWFDGDGMLHGVRLRDGKASYRNRYVRTEGFVEEEKAKKALYTGLAEIPDLQKLAQGKDVHKNTANTALAWHNGKLLALWEGGAPHEIKVPTLETVGKFTFDDKLKHKCTAHPKIDPDTGEMLFFGYQPVKPFLQYSIADAKGVIKRTTAIELPRAVMMHDFAVSSKHTIFMDLPVVFDIQRMLTGKGALAYNAKFGARFGVMPREGTAKEVQWFESEPCYVFHTLNAYDDGDEVVLLACRMPAFPDEITPPDLMSDEQMKKTGAFLYRWRFNRKTGKTKEEAVSDLVADFPRLNESLTGKKNRYGYLMALKMDALVKHDLEKGTSVRHEFGKARLGGEAVFVPRPGGKGEDDGWLLTYVYDGDEEERAARGRGARLHRETGGVRAAAVRVPFGFHGAWVPNV